MNFKVVLTDHAQWEAERRQIDLGIIKKVVKNPQQQVRLGKRMIFQEKYFDKFQEKEMLLRTVVEEKGDTRRVITVYKTSKIEKYWKEESKNEGDI